MSGGVVRYKTAGNAAEPSPSIWADCPVLQFITDPGEGIYIWDDFVKGGVVANTSVPGWDFVGTNADVSQVVDVADGRILLAGSGADNDSAFIATPDLYLLTMKNRKRFWLEAYVQLPEAGAADDFAAFVGMVEKVGATAELIADNGATVIDEDFVGFFADTNGTAVQAWNATINQGGSATLPANVLADAVAVSTSWVKLGITFDGEQTIRFYADGVLLATYDVDGLASNTMAHELCVAIGVKDGEADALGINVGWVRFACDKVAQG